MRSHTFRLLMPVSPFTTRLASHNMNLSAKFDIYIGLILYHIHDVNSFSYRVFS